MFNGRIKEKVYIEFASLRYKEKLGIEKPHLFFLYF